MTHDHVDTTSMAGVLVVGVGLLCPPEDPWSSWGGLGRYCDGPVFLV